MQYNNKSHSLFLSKRWHIFRRTLPQCTYTLYKKSFLPCYLFFLILRVFVFYVCDVYARSCAIRITYV